MSLNIPVFLDVLFKNQIGDNRLTKEEITKLLFSPLIKATIKSDDLKKIYKGMIDEDFYKKILQLRSEEFNSQHFSENCSVIEKSLNIEGFLCEIYPYIYSSSLSSSDTTRVIKRAKKKTFSEFIEELLYLLCYLDETNCKGFDLNYKEKSNNSYWQTLIVALILTFFQIISFWCGITLESLLAFIICIMFTIVQIFLTRIIIKIISRTTIYKIRQFSFSSKLLLSIIMVSIFFLIGIQWYNFSTKIENEVDNSQFFPINVKRSLVGSDLDLAVIFDEQTLVNGPDRKLFESAPDFPILNSSISNIGWKSLNLSETEFTFIREVSSLEDNNEVDEWYNEMDIEIGKTYEVSSLYHNNSTVPIFGVGARAQIPTTILSNQRGILNTILFFKENDKINEIWSGSLVKNITNESVTIQPIPESLSIDSSGDIASTFGDSKHMIPAFFTNGITLGYDADDGTLPANDWGRINYRFTVEPTDMEVKTYLSKYPDHIWKNGLIASPEEHLRVCISIKNVSNQTLKDINIAVGPLSSDTDNRFFKNILDTVTISDKKDVKRATHRLGNGITSKEGIQIDEIGEGQERFIMFRIKMKERSFFTTSKSFNRLSVFINNEKYGSTHNAYIMLLN